jgi:hypothetical protein
MKLHSRCHSQSVEILLLVEALTVRLLTVMLSWMVNCSLNLNGDKLKGYSLRPPYAVICAVTVSCMCWCLHFQLKVILLVKRGLEWAFLYYNTVTT